MVHDVRFRALAAQGDVLQLHVSGLSGGEEGVDGFGAYTLDVDVLPQVTSIQAEAPPGTNAVTSLSLDPLLLLVAFDNGSRTLPVVRQAGRFAVNILRAGQEDLARIFASKRVAEEKFDAVTHTVAHGVPVLDDALAWVACDLESLTPAGDHTIGIGRVTNLGADDAALDPLLFFRGHFGRLARP